MTQEGRVALVTGAGVRLGRAIGLDLAQAGWDVAIHYAHSETGALGVRETAQRLGRRAEIFQADLTEAAAASALPSRVTQKFGALNLVVNSAAIMEVGPLGGVTPEMWDRAMDLNVRAAFFIVQGAMSALRAARGKIVNIADASGLQAWPDYIPLSTSKAAMIMLTKCLAKALAPDVQVNAIAPGPVLMPAGSTPADEERARQATVLRRLGSPQDVTGAVRFLVESGDYVTGVTLPVDGGRAIV